MVTHAYPRWDGDIAGVFIERLAVAMVARGQHITVVAPADEGAGGQERRRGVEIVRVRYGPARAETLAYRGTMQQRADTTAGKVALASLINAEARAVARLSRAGAAHVVHAHWWVPGGMAAWLARFTGRRPFIVTLHGTDVAVLEQSRTARFLARRVLGRANLVTAVSSFLVDRVHASLGLDKDAIVVQPMPSTFGHLDHTSRGGGGVVTVGRLVGQKRVHLVLEAIARLRQNEKPLRLTVVGDGPKRTALEMLAAQLGVDDLTRFCRTLPPERLVDAIRDADVFAFPAQGEGFGLAVAEALMLGIPVVACEDGGGVVDIVPRSGAGRIVPPNDAAQLARGIDELTSDPRARAAAAESGRLLRRRLDPDYVAGTFETLYDRVVRARGRP